MSVHVEHNRVFVSEIDNPFYFPSDTRYTVGQGRIMAECSIVMNVTDRNFGQYPVYVFTTDGVFVLIGSDVENVHSYINAPVSIEAPVSDVICPTPFGIAYISRSGLMLINQYQAVCISDVFSTRYVSDKYVYPSFSTEGYVTNMYYVPHNQELKIVTSEENDLVYSFRYKRFHAVSDGAIDLLANGYPHIFVLYENKDGARQIRNEEDFDIEVPVDVSFVTRVLRFGSSDVKSLQRIILRGLFHEYRTDEREGLRLMHSNSGYDMYDELHTTEDDGNKERGDNNFIIRRYRDIDSGLLIREKYRFYALRFSAKLYPDSMIDLLEVMIGRRYNNKGMR